MKKANLFLVGLAALVALSIGFFACNNNQKENRTAQEKTAQKQEKIDNSWLIGNWEQATISNAKNFGEDIQYMQFEITILSENRLYMSSLTKLTPRGWVKYRQQNHYSSDSDLLYAKQEYEYTIDNERNAIYCGSFDYSDPIYFNKDTKTLNIHGTIVKKKPPKPKEDSIERYTADSYVDCYERIIAAAIQVEGIYPGQYKEMRVNSTKTHTKFTFEKDKTDKNILMVTICEETQTEDGFLEREIYKGQFCFRGFQSKKWQLTKYDDTKGRYAVFSCSKEDGSIVNCYLNTESGGAAGSIWFKIRVEGWKDILFVGSKELRDYDNSLKNINQKTANDAIDIDENGYSNNISALKRIEKATNASNSNDTQIFEQVDQMPVFPGGETKLMNWIAENLKYPSTAIEQEIQGRVIVKFVVNRDGSIGNVEVVRSLETNCDQEAIRLVKSMPNWKPGKIKDDIVATYYTLPVRFKIQ